MSDQPDSHTDCDLWHVRSTNNQEVKSDLHLRSDQNRTERERERFIRINVRSILFAGSTFCCPVGLALVWVLTWSGSWLGLGSGGLDYNTEDWQRMLQRNVSFCHQRATLHVRRSSCFPSICHSELFSDYWCLLSWLHQKQNSSPHPRDGFQAHYWWLTKAQIIGQFGRFLHQSGMFSTIVT